MTRLPLHSSLAIAGLWFAVACEAPSTLASCATDAVMVAMQSDTVPELRVCPTRDSYAAGQPVEVLLVLRGTNGPIPINNHPDSYEYSVVGENGDTLRSLDTFHAILHYEDRGKLTLPVRGAVTRVVDLNCMRPSLVAPDTLFPACWGRFPFATGEYTLTVTWRSPREALVDVPSGGAVQRLAARPVRIRVR
jgi:hypothetical protein